MKVAILAGGKGVRYSQGNPCVPKPLAPIGGQPILWHVLKYYQSFGFSDFVVAVGHRGQEIRDHFKSQTLCSTFNGNGHRNGSHSSFLNGSTQAIEFVDTGDSTLTGTRVGKLKEQLADGTFMLTWSDGLADINLEELLAFHRSHKKLATVTAVQRPPRFGELTIDGERVAAFQEKPQRSNKDWINGAFFVLEPEVFDYIPDCNVSWESEPLERLVRDGQLMAYRHFGFWRCMDTVGEQQQLDELWRSGKAPWKRWN